MKCIIRMAKFGIGIRKYEVDNRDTEEVLSEAPVFIELGKTGCTAVCVW